MIEGLIKIMRKTISASWLFETKLKNHNNLFLNDELADEYLVRAYSCKCGHDEIVTGDDVNKYYACTSCNNDIFMNTDDIYPDMESFVENTYYNRRINLKFNVSYEVGIYKNKVQAIAKIKIPTKIDFIKSKIIKQDVIVVGMPFKERMEKIVRSPFSSILIKLQKLALNKELFEPFIDLKLSRSDKIKRKQFPFVLNHYNLKDLKFMNWTNTDYLIEESYTIETALEKIANNKTAKSVKKAIFENYEYQIKNSKKFNPNFLNIVTLKIDDVNHIVSLLKLELCHDYFEDYELVDKFFNFLLDRYSQKQVVYFFSNIYDELIFRDTLWMFKSLRYYLDASIEKVNCSLEHIHNQFIKLSKKLEYEKKELVKFVYTDFQLNYLKEIEQYTIRLPENNYELFAWSDILENCLASYEYFIELQKTTVYGFFIKNKLIFAVEICDGKIIQAYRKYNQPLDSFENKVLNLWYLDLTNKINTNK